MAKQTDNTEQNGNVSEVEGIRVKVKPETVSNLDSLATATGLTRGELVDAATEMLMQNGKQFLADSIIRNAQAKVEALLKG